MLNRISLRSVSKFLSIVYVVYGLQTQAWAQNVCTDLFEQPIYGTVRGDFVYNTHYTKEITSVGEIKNQCTLGTCHLFAWTSKLESDYKNKTNHEIKISADYLSAQRWLNSSLELVEKGLLESKPKLGNTTAFSRDLIIEFGVMPEGIWSPRVGFSLAANVKNLERYLQNILSRIKVEMKDLKDDSAEKKALVEKAKQQIRSLFKNMVGSPPDQFVYEGKTYTAKEFQQAFFPELSNPLTVLEAANNRKDKEGILKQSKKNVNIMENVSLDKIEKKIIELIDKNQPVALSYYHDGAFIDKETGNMSFRALFFPSEARPLSRAVRSDKGLNEGGHAVVIVGYDLDAVTGKVIKYKIQNSWGQKSGDQGFYHMYADYFRAFVNRIHYYE